MPHTTPGVAVRSGKETPVDMRDPIGILRLLLESGLPPEACWPAGEEGMREVLHTRDGPPAPDSLAAKRLIAADDGTAVSAIRVHRKEKALLNAAKVAICHFGWLFDPTLAVVIAATPAEQQRIQALLARWWKEEFIPPGMDPAAAPSVVLAETIGRRRWQEVIVAPGCLALRGRLLADVVAAAALGLHAPPMPR